jgi:hypothetical protein
MKTAILLILTLGSIFAADDKKPPAAIAAPAPAPTPKPVEVDVNALVAYKDLRIAQEQANNAQAKLDDAKAKWDPIARDLMSRGCQIALDPRRDTIFCAKEK